MFYLDGIVAFYWVVHDFSKIHYNSLSETNKSLDSKKEADDYTDRLESNQASKSYYIWFILSLSQSSNFLLS